MSNSQGYNVDMYIMGGCTFLPLVSTNLAHTTINTGDDTATFIQFCSITVQIQNHESLGK